MSLSRAENGYTFKLTGVSESAVADIIRWTDRINLGQQPPHVVAFLAQVGNALNWRPTERSVAEGWES